MPTMDLEYHISIYTVSGIYHFYDTEPNRSIQNMLACDSATTMLQLYVHNRFDFHFKLSIYILLRGGYYANNGFDTSIVYIPFKRASYHLWYKPITVQSKLVATVTTMLRVIYVQSVDSIFNWWIRFMLMAGHLCQLWVWLSLSYIYRYGIIPFMYDYNQTVNQKITVFATALHHCCNYMFSPVDSVLNYPIMVVQASGIH
jgi:hypothetical protein